MHWTYMAKGCWAGFSHEHWTALSGLGAQHCNPPLGVPPPVPSDPTLAGLLPVERQAPGGPPPPVGAVSSGLKSVYTL